MKKKVSCIALSMLLASGMVPATVQAASYSVTGDTVATEWGTGGAIDENGTLWVWGGGGEMASFGYTPETRNYNEPYPILENIVSYDYGDQSAAAIDKDGGLWVWGSNLDGCLTFDPAIKEIKVPTKIMDNAAFVDIKTHHAMDPEGVLMVIDKNGTLWGSGTNADHQISSSDQKYYAKLTKIMENVVDVSNGAELITAVTTNGDMYVWGDDYKGIFEKYWTQKPDKWGIVSSDISKPVKVMSNIRKAEVSFQHQIAAIDKNDTLWLWGSDHSGIFWEMTHSFGNIFTEPMKIMENVKDVKMLFGNCALILCNNGDLYSYGENSAGILGVGSNDQVYHTTKPEKILEDVVSMSCFNAAFAITENGDLYGWGFNSIGQLCGSSVCDFTDRSHLRCQSKPVKLMENMAQPVSISLNIREKATATPTDSKIFVNGKEIAFDAYNINGNNYFKLRDVAYAVNGTEKQFNVGWDAVKKAISLTSEQAYTGTGGTVSAQKAKKTAITTDSPIYIDGTKAEFTAYNIDGNNYFKLRDLGKVFDFNIGWNGSANAVTIDTTKNYE